MKNIWSTVHKFIDSLALPGNGQNRLKRYGFVLLLVGAFFLLKSTLFAVVGKEVPFLFALFVVISSAWFGGFRPGVFATVLTGALTYFFFLEPKYTFFGEENIPNLVIMGTFFLEGIFISLLSESHRKSDTQRSEFVGVISHELKNPLTSIKGYAELIHKVAGNKGEKRLAEFASRIDYQVKNVLEMINEMLDITKIETGRLTYSDEIFDINELVKEIVEDQKVIVRTHKIQLTRNGVMYLHADRYRIGQVITNLISNAVKYSPDAKHIKVAVQKKRSYALISVQDFGVGISAQDQKRLFTPFFRAQTAQGLRGTGIGLYISSEIVSRHNGKIWGKSTAGKGSTFFVKLPL